LIRFSHYCKLVWWQIIIVSFPIYRPTILCLFMSPPWGLRRLGTPVHWIAWTPGFYSLVTTPYLPVGGRHSPVSEQYNTKYNTFFTLDIARCIFELCHGSSTIPSSRPFRGMASISWECSPLLVGMLSSAVIVMVCYHTVFVQYAISLLCRCFVVICNCQNSTRFRPSRNYCVLSMGWYLCRCLMFLELILCQSHYVLGNYFTYF